MRFSLTETQWTCLAYGAAMVAGYLYAAAGLCW